MERSEQDGAPYAEDIGVACEEDVYDLIESCELGTFAEYDFSCLEEMVDYVLGRNGYQGIVDHEDLEEHQESIDDVLDRDYEHEGGVWYNPENTDSWITADEDLMQ